MGVGAMIGDVIRSLFKKPATEFYPFVKTAAPDRFRGKLHYDPEKCSGCMLCIKDCPSNAIELITVDKANKRFVMRYHADQCVYCSQCVENCRFKCLSLSNEEWEMASTNKQAFEVTYGREEDIAVLLSRAARPGENEPSCE
jgi:NAD(P)H-quinone oxidoreductase subunit I